MIPYTAEEMDYLNTGKYRKSNQNRQRRVPQEDPRQWSRAWGIRTTIEVDGKEYVVPIQL